MYKFANFSGTKSSFFKLSWKVNAAPKNKIASVVDHLLQINTIESLRIVI